MQEPGAEAATPPSKTRDTATPPSKRPVCWSLHKFFNTSPGSASPRNSGCFAALVARQPEPAPRKSWKASAEAEAAAQATAIVQAKEQHETVETALIEQPPAAAPKRKWRGGRPPKGSRGRQAALHSADRPAKGLALLRGQSQADTARRHAHEGLRWPSARHRLQRSNSQACVRPS